MTVTGAIIVPHPPIILPEVGGGREQEIRKTIAAYREAAGRLADWRPETIVILSPHAEMYGDYFHVSPGKSAAGDLRDFGVPEVKVLAAYDDALVKALTDKAQGEGVPTGILGKRMEGLDHGVVIPLRFLEESYRARKSALPKIVRVGLSGLSPSEHYRLGKCIAQTADGLGRKTAVIASGDLSHRLLSDGPYGFAKEGPVFDKQVTEAMAKGDFLKFLELDGALAEAAAECGLRAFQIMAGTLDGLAVEPTLLSYEGPFGVGYGVAVFEVTGSDETRHFDRVYEERLLKRLKEERSAEDLYVELARLSLETYIRTGKRAALPQGLPPELMNRRAGVFVSLKKEGQLRGCIGTIGPVAGSIAEEILRNAVSAGCEDPRFSPVQVSELDTLVYSVDVLGEPEDIGLESSLLDAKSQLDPKRYGIIVEKDGRRGLLLPNLEGVDTPRQQIQIAKQKAGIVASEDCRLQRFEVVRHR